MENEEFDDIPREEVDKIRLETREEYYKRKNTERKDNGCVLPQDEVDALLMGLSGGNYQSDYDKVHGSNNDDGNDDMCKIRRLLQVEVLSDRFARIATNSLSNMFGTRIELNPISVDAQTFGDFMRSLPVPTEIGIFSAPNVFTTQFLSVFDARSVFSFVESAFGTYPHQPRVEGREFTRIEQAILEKVQKKCANGFTKAWAACIANMYAKYDRSEINPQFSSITDRKDPVIVIVYEMEMDTSLGTYIQVIPYKSLEPYAPVLASGNSGLRVFTCSPEELVHFIKNGSKYNNKHGNGSGDNYDHKFFDPERKYLRFLNNVNPRNLAQFMRNEHPQTIACVATYMNNDRAADFLLCLPAGFRAEVLLRMESGVYIRNNAFIEALDACLRRVEVLVPVQTYRKGRAVLEEIKTIEPLAYDELVEEISEEDKRFFDD